MHAELFSRLATCVIAVAIALTIALPANAQDKEDVVVLPLKSRRLPKETLEILDELLVYSIVALGEYNAITRQDIEAQLNREQLKDMLGCDDVRCAADLGGALGAPYLLSGSARKLGANLMLSLSLIDTQAQKTRRGQAVFVNREESYPAGIDAAVRDVLGLPDARPSGTTTTAPPAAPATPRGAAKFSSISAGGRHNCGLKTDGTIACWGDNGQGEANAPAGKFIQVVAGYDHSCALKSDQTVVCWGWNNWGQTKTPAGRFTRIETKYFHTCGIKPDGGILCWGRNEQGQLNAPGGRFSQIAPGGAHTCGFKDGKLRCWGWNFTGQLNVPAGSFTWASAGGGHNCAMGSAGDVTCWGENDHGQTRAPRGRFSSLAVGWKHNCAIQNQTAICWGLNGDGQSTATGDRFVQLASGQFHTCGIRSDQTVACWGKNDVGQSTPP